MNNKISVTEGKWRLGSVWCEGDRGPRFKLPAIFQGNKEICHGVDKEQLRKVVAAHNSSLSVTEAHPKKDFLQWWKTVWNTPPFSEVDSNVAELIWKAVTEAHPKEEKPFADWQDDPEKVKAHAEFTADVSAARKKEASSEPVKLSELPEEQKQDKDWKEHHE